MVPFQQINASAINSGVWLAPCARIRGMFRLALTRSRVCAVSSQATNLAIAQQSIVLLKNINNTLPLNPTAFKNIAVIGPNAELVPLANCELASFR